MSTPPPQEDAHRTRTVAYDSDEFDQVVSGIGDSIRSGDGIVLLFVGASEEQRQEGLTRVSAQDELNLHRFRVPNLIGERLVETQGNLREAFDHADEDAAVLFFDEADILFDTSLDLEADPEEQEKSEQEGIALSNYFFDRVEAYPGVSIVCFSSPQYVNRLEEHTPDVVVEF